MKIHPVHQVDLFCLIELKLTLFSTYLRYLFSAVHQEENSSGCCFAIDQQWRRPPIPKPQTYHFLLWASKPWRGPPAGVPGAGRARGGRHGLRRGVPAQARCHPSRWGGRGRCRPAAEGTPGLAVGATAGVEQGPRGAPPPKWIGPELNTFWQNCTGHQVLDGQKFNFQALTPDLQVGRVAPEGLNHLWHVLQCL